MIIVNICRPLIYVVCRCFLPEASVYYRQFENMHSYLDEIKHVINQSKRIIREAGIPQQMNAIIKK